MKLTSELPMLQYLMLGNKEKCTIGPMKLQYNERVQIRVCYRIKYFYNNMWILSLWGILSNPLMSLIIKQGHEFNGK